MTLILEDGTGRSDSESYADAAALKAYAAKYGLTVPAAVPALEALLRRAADQMLTVRWKGDRTVLTQAQAFPRRNVVVGYAYIPITQIPARIEYGQMALAIEIYADDVAPPELKVGPATLKRVEGAVTVQYAKLSEVGSTKILPAAPQRPSLTQFWDYLQPGALSIVPIRR